jgi:ABC-2 type transport system ATP-binding protein
VLFYVGLGEARYRNVDTYSTGMRQRIKLAQALAHDPELLFLDEPTNGMDPAGREEMLELVGDLVRNHNVNVIVSSHVLPDIGATCSHVVVMDKGRVAASGPIAGLKQSQGQIFELRVRASRGIEAFVAALKGAGLELSIDDHQVMRVFVPGERGAQDLFALSAREGAQVRHLRPSLPTLEDVFAHAVGER